MRRFLLLAFVTSVAVSTVTCSDGVGPEPVDETALIRYPEEPCVRCLLSPAHKKAVISGKPRHFSPGSPREVHPSVRAPRPTAMPNP